MVVLTPMPKPDISDEIEQTAEVAPRNAVRVAPASWHFTVMAFSMLFTVPLIVLVSINPWMLGMAPYEYPKKALV